MTFAWDSMVVGLMTGEIGTEMDMDDILNHTHYASEQVKLHNERRDLSERGEKAQRIALMKEYGVRQNDGETELEMLGNLIATSEMRRFLLERHERTIDALNARIAELEAERA